MEIAITVLYTWMYNSPAGLSIPCRGKYVVKVFSIDHAYPLNGWI
jgi:hypothetical protein